MGEKIVAGGFDLSDRQRYRRKLQQCLAGLGRLLAEKRFDRPRNLMGLEIELNLAGSDGLPRMMNAEVLDRIASRDFQTELGMFNLEVNIAPHRLGGRVLDQLAEELRTGLGYAHRKAAEVDAGIVMIGILPTLDAGDLVSANLSDVDRYVLLNDQIVTARGEDFTLDIEGVERLSCTSSSIAPEAACTSVQLHLQVTPGRFARVWNAAQAVAAVQIAVGANSPFLFGKELWRESRPPLFQQATDTRPPELQAQGVRPRTWFGERWVGSAYELFEENLRFFPALLPICDDEEPLRVLDDGGVPRLQELVLHNGTVYRWNRPVYGLADGVPHLRVENRVLPAGPTVTDVVANAAFYYGLVRALAEEPRPLWTRMPFETAAANFENACRHGIEAELEWPRPGRGGGLTRVPAVKLVRDELLPLAAAGLEAWNVEPADRDFYLGVIEGRCRRRVNGASWQVDAFHRALDSGLDRRAALAAVTRRYSVLMHADEPVHTWPAGPGD
ncbi:glutamate-cysteine ligase family protein [Streptomyces tirandamycinicus]|uniref:Glutamate--cysteine ligase n=1 Tax=Streptomyces tirandamycinicus TaxID=2174846 RepID=A0A2S1SS47_9ACTN|nr:MULTISPECIES: glutamate-cysteine ligase family protein [Streptomyces]AWI29231.1 glutamate--cysteine ligase [Streptomyces tirandamycinicus]MCY0985216.1 glutamate-cysteine ligase family protein [Streptomyces tirandamycinicus]NNJ04635.1 glutamate--cysteine ligase [Streptomyces sp. PKU-MA01144]TFE56387.1 glutamate--cysteine ligase [Streptomyces sp. ICN441]